MNLLQFNKISNDHKFAGVGFAGNIFIVLNALSQISNDKKLFVDMSKNACVCTEKEHTLFNTDNCWEYYFDQEARPVHVDQFFDSVTCGSISYNNQEIFKDPSDFVTLKDKFYNSFSLKEDLNQKINEYYESKIKNLVTLGVQVRLTDMKRYNNVSDIQQYINSIKKILIENASIQQIFLASDSIESIHEIQRSVDIPIIYHEDFYRADIINQHLDPYDRHAYVRPMHNYKLGLECMREIYALSKCDFLLKADISAISMVSIMLTENIKKVYSNDLFNR
jgi:hypothetical protein